MGSEIPDRVGRAPVGLGRAARALGLAFALLLAASGTGLAQSPTLDNGTIWAQTVVAQSATAAPAAGAAPPASAGQPRFSNLGPSQPAPDVEGPPRATSVMPPNRTQRCRWDLAGAWEGRGQQTDPTSNTYNTRLVVQQFGNFLVAQQPADSISYYGVCSGDRVELDAYSGDGTYIGVQTGTVSGNGRRIETTWVLYRPDYAAGYETLTAAARPSR